MLVIGNKTKLDFPEDYGSEESHEHFWDRMVCLVAEWLETDIEVSEVTDLAQLIPDYPEFKKWLSIFDPDVLQFIEFLEYLEKKAVELKEVKNVD